MTYNFLTAGLQNVLLLLAVVEELSIKICAKDLAVLDLILLIFALLCYLFISVFIETETFS